MPDDPINSPYSTEEERAWANQGSPQGIDPRLLSARRSDFSESTDAVSGDAAALSPLLIPFGSILAGPLVAAGLAIFTDGRPPSPRFAILALSIGAAGWLMVQGIAYASGIWLSPMHGSLLRLGLLFLVGLLLYGLYVRSPDRLQRIDRRTLTASAVVLLVLSALFWIARDTTWWSWLGR